MAKMSGHKLGHGSKLRVRKQVSDLCATIARVDGWVDVVVAALTFGDVSGYSWLGDVAWVYAALQNVHQSNDSAEDWDTAMEECVPCLLEALCHAGEVPVPSEKVLQVILKALSTEGPCSNQAMKLLIKAKSWFIDTDFQSTMQKHNVWSQMGVVIMKTSLQTQVYGEEYIQLGEMLSSITEWTSYIRRNPLHWTTTYLGMSEHTQEKLQTPYLSVLERIWGQKYTGTYWFTKDSEKILAWTQIALTIVWEGFDFSGQQTLQDFHQLIRCTISTAFRSQYKFYTIYTGRAHNILISPNFRAAFYTPLGDSLIQAARNAEDMVPGGPTQSDNQDGPLQEKTQGSQVLQQAARILDKMGQALKLESEGEQVDRGEERAEQYWNNLRAHFEAQVDGLEKSLKETPGTAKISP
ncbi:hypothetical protein C8J57DRAFT_1679668 [Mycena rebaudengoi]|nr:hypothetical protein C8J57DRAFT_1679668 [Mycena rebaudengoi]